MPARYALVELVNLYDDSLEFEAIHRVLFGVDPKKLMADFLAAYPGAHYGEGEGHQITYVLPGGEKGVVTVPNPTAQLEVGTLQTFLDKYLEENGGKIDYIHGEDVVREPGQPARQHRLPAAFHDQGPALPHRHLRRRSAPEDLLHGRGPRQALLYGSPEDQVISLTLPAPAKINLTLDILGARPDGYHEMEMVMQSVSLCDTIRLDLGFAGGIRASSGLQFLPNDKDNLAVAAALAFRKATGQTWRDLLNYDREAHPRLRRYRWRQQRRRRCPAWAERADRRRLISPGAGKDRGGSRLRCPLLCPGHHRPGGRPGGGTDPAPPPAALLDRALQAPVFHLHPSPLPGLGQGEAPPAA